MIMVSDGTNTQVVWVSDPGTQVVTPDGTTLTALWSGELTALEREQAINTLASEPLAKCRLSVWRPKRSGIEITNKSKQTCWTSLAEYHESWLELQKRPQGSSWRVVDEDRDAGPASQLAPLWMYGWYDCVLRRASDYRSLGWGELQLTDGNVIDIGPLYSRTRTACT